jgi:uncharacterized protein (DUF1015 family)
VPRVAPFVALRYDSAVAGPLDRLTAPPYDVISDSRRRSYLDSSAQNIVHVDLAEGSPDPEAADSRYAAAAGLLHDWRVRGVLRPAGPAYFAHEFRFTLEGRRRSVRGVLCAMDLEPLGDGVLPHEETMPGPIEDRLRLLRATGTHLSAIYGTVAGPCEQLAELLDRTTEQEPLAAVTDREGVDHRLWQVPAEAPVGSWLASEPLLIADGHHRYTTALAYRDERHAEAGPGPWDRILTLVVDAGTQDVPVLPYHRVQTEGDPPPDGDPVADLASALAVLDDAALRFGTVAAVRGGVEYRIHTLHGSPPTVEALHEQLLDALAPGDGLRFTHDAEDADEVVRTGQARVAYLLPPTTPERIRAVVDRGGRLPRKSTFFWPKPRTGMVLMPLDGSQPD